MYVDVTANSHDTVVYSPHDNSAYLVDGSAEELLRDVYTVTDTGDLKVPHSRTLTLCQVAMVSSAALIVVIVALSSTIPGLMVLGGVGIFSLVCTLAAATVGRLHSEVTTKFNEGIVLPLPDLKNPDAVTPDAAEVLTNLAEEGNIADFNRYARVIDSIESEPPTRTGLMRLTSEKSKIASRI